VDQPTAAVNSISVRATKIRWFGGWLVFFLCFVAYLDRIAFSVNASRIMEAISITPISTDIGQQFTSTVGSWMNMWGFIAASIVPTVAPIIAKSYGWNQVLIVNAGVIVLGIIGYLLIKTDQPLRMSE
jgi:hypothetical protein